jgi:hypothetical protein
MAYVYRHIRLDKNEPFYIGIGSDTNYKRANWKFRNNNIWNSIVNKTSYEVEILLDNITWDQACIKEKEFINLYGRKDIKTGILSNLTYGGEGTFGHILNEETKKNISKKLKGRKLSNETCIKMSNSRIGNIPSNKGLKMSDEQKEKISLANKGRKKPLAKCPYCNIIGGISVLKRFHFDNCKYKLNV